MKALTLLTLLVGLGTPTADLAGQAVAVRALVALPRSSVRLSDATERGQGVWGGLAIEFQAGRFTLAGRGVRGRLTATSTALLERQVGELSVDSRYQVQPWLAFAAEYGARAFSSAAGLQRWNLWGGSGTVSRELGMPGVRAFASFRYMPVITVTAQDRTTGWGTDAGVTIAPDRAPVFVRLDYRIERIAFPQITSRSEQFEALTLSVGIRVQRLDGGWTIRGGGAKRGASN